VEHPLLLALVGPLPSLILLHHGPWPDNLSPRLDGSDCFLVDRCRKVSVLQLGLVVLQEQIVLRDLLFDLGKDADGALYALTGRVNFAHLIVLDFVLLKSVDELFANSDYVS
jgi:hypothetical protein